MSQTFYHDHYPPSMTVGELIKHLRAFDPTKQVVFKTPRYGVFGSGTVYPVEKVSAEVSARHEKSFPAGIRPNEETGEDEPYEGWTEVRLAWGGVVIG